jgi:hypothetical protein
MTEELGRYAVEFDFEGQTYGVDLPAYGPDDANRKLMALKQSGRVMGRIHLQVKLPMPIMMAALPFLWVFFQVWAFFKGPPKDSDR